MPNVKSRLIQASKDRTRDFIKPQYLTQGTDISKIEAGRILSSLEKKGLLEKWSKSTGRGGTTYKIKYQKQDIEKLDKRDSWKSNSD
ncbi:hypothetical protein [Candidatus Nanohalovita haloferacivicina]|uniref:hypothetical protein n=1 Tax=Candidatus Nanohalovita haloferacivicina TaxID=2978046 RepID=UPI00325FD9D3|nr:hypothetical protein HBNXNv_0800 [Candidatus Nanohalobia archaeon BNXNv]